MQSLTLILTLPLTLKDGPLPGVQLKLPYSYTYPYSYSPVLLPATAALQGSKPFGRRKCLRYGPLKGRPWKMKRMPRSPNP